ncbi:SHIRT domain-containing protein [Parvimonas sp. G1967]|uniref:SHIRT domain-containing protein n=1 Tax=Parvimonas sp. G1967 TaxID=3387695 RepID=UPI0039E6F6F5
MKPRATEDRYSVTFSFVSGTEGKDLPAEVLGLKPADKTNVEPGTNIDLPKPANVDVAGGTWYFLKWTAKIGQATIDLGDSIQVDNQDLNIVGIWIFRANPNPEKYNVTYKFVSETEGAVIPQDVLDKKPADQTDVSAGTNIPLENLGEVIVPTGVWRFVKWTAKIGQATVDLEDSIQVDNQDLEIVGHWIYEAYPPLDKHTVFYVFESGTDGKDLPQEVMDKKPADNPNALNGSPVQIFDIEDVEVADGTWKLEGWYREVDGERKLIDSEVMVEDEDITVYGVWKFTEKNNEPDPEKYNVTFHFVTLTLGKELPAEVLTKKPANQSDLPSGTVIPLPKYEDVKVEGGTWKFRYWYLSLGDHGHEVENEITVENADLFLIGGWEFEKDPEPKKYNVEFSFYSVTKGKELPDEIKAKLPANQINVLKGTVITLPTYEDVKVEGGKWIFEGWLLETEFGYIDVKNEVVVNNGNLFLAGPWRFEADKKPAPPKPLKPQKPKVQKGRMLPKTNVESAFSYVILALAGIGGAYITKKKDK